MTIDTENNLKQAILSRVELSGVEAAQTHYLDALPPLSVERRRVQRVFSQLEQDRSGKWSFKPQ